MEVAKYAPLTGSPSLLQTQVKELHNLGSTSENKMGYLYKKNNVSTMQLNSHY